MRLNTVAAGFVHSADHALLWEWASNSATSAEGGESWLRLASGRPVTARARRLEEGGLLVRLNR